MDTETVTQSTAVSSREKALKCAQAALDKKAENVQILDLSEMSAFTEYFIICSGTSDRHVQAVTDSIAHAMSASGFELLSAEGYADGRWVLMDFGDVIVHAFIDAVREYYDLEALWTDAPKLKIPAEYYGPGASRLN